MLFQPNDPLADLKIPALREISPDLARLEDRLASLNARRTEAIGELRDLVRGQDDIPAARTDHETKKTRRVDALVSGPNAPDDAAPGGDEWRSHYWGLQTEIADIDAAIPILTQKYQAAYRAASADACAQLRDVHRLLVRDLAAALGEIHRANERYWKFGDQLNKQGISWGGLGASFIRAIGHPRDRESSLAYWFREAVAEGHIKASEIPDGLR